MSKSKEELNVSTPNASGNKEFLSSEQKHYYLFFKLVNSVVKAVLVETMRRLWSHQCMNTKNGTMTLEQYFESLNYGNVKKKELRKLLGVKPGDQIDESANVICQSNLMTYDVEISAAYCIISGADFCGRKGGSFKLLSEEVQEGLKKLKETRNRVCHQNQKMSKRFRDDVMEIQTWTVAVYTELRNMFRDKKYSDDISNATKEIKFILDMENNTINIFLNYFREHANFQDEPTSKLITYGREELHDFYQGLTVLNPCTLMDENHFSEFKVEKIFTSVEMKIRNTVDLIKTEDILTATVQYNKMFQVPQVIIISGQGGSGKTSLCRYFLTSWQVEDNKIVDLKYFDLALFVEVRTVRAKSAINFINGHLLKNTMKRLRLDGAEIGDDKAIGLLKDLKILFIIDGYDEATSISKQLIKDLLFNFGGKTPNVRFVFTTRPELCEELEITLRDYKMLGRVVIQIRGFEIDQRKQFSKKVFEILRESTEKKVPHTSVDLFLSFLESRERYLKNQLCLPLTVSLLIILWHNDHKTAEKVTSVTRLYYEIFKCLKKKLMDRLVALDYPLPKLDEKLEKLLVFLGIQAHSMLMEDVLPLVIDEQKWETIVQAWTKEGLQKNHWIQFFSAFLMSDGNGIRDSVCQKPNESEYGIKFQFIHRSQQEYLTAMYLATEISMGVDVSILLQCPQFKQFPQILVFMIGHLEINDFLNPKIGKTKILAQINPILNRIDSFDVEPSKFNYWWIIMNECKSNRSVMDWIVRHLTLEWNLTDKTVVSGLELLYETGIPVKAIMVKIPIGVEPYKIPGFLDVLQKIQLKAQNSSNWNPVSVELIFMEHNHKGGSSKDGDPKSSDELLLTLTPWAHLANFEGHLGASCEEFLSKCTQVKGFRVRVTSVDGLNVLAGASKKLLRNNKLRSLRLTVDLIPGTSSLELLPILFKADLELIFVNCVSDDEIYWLLDVILAICPRSGGYDSGCYRLSLENCSLSLRGYRILVLAFKGIVQNKLFLDPGILTEEEKQEVTEVVEKGNLYTFEWL